jgi:hypothetical protein
MIVGMIKAAITKAASMPTTIAGSSQGGERTNLGAAYLTIVPPTITPAKPLPAATTIFRKVTRGMFMQCILAV